LWARGNGWVALSFNEVLKRSKPGSPMRERLLASYRRQAQGILSRQDPTTGLWHTVMDAPDTYLETSASAMFLAALAESHSAGILRQPDLGVLRRAWTGLAQQVDPEGRVIHVSAGTRPSTKEKYAAVPLGTFTWGTGAFLLAASAWEELEHR
jgi:unsaturated rhamnogalacturonyl hydrolase